MHAAYTAIVSFFAHRDVVVGFGAVGFSWGPLSALLNPDIGSAELTLP